MTATQMARRDRRGGEAMERPREEDRDGDRGHGLAETHGEETDGGGLGAIVELPEDGIDEDGDCEFGADQKSDAKDGGDIER